MEGMMGLVSKSTPSGYTFLAERSGSNLFNKMDELACFAPGMLALGTEGAPPEKAEKYLTLAKEVRH
jgi:mannosyl-oligosaccharide alpha-1,2-mannosidase